MLTQHFLSFIIIIISRDIKSKFSHDVKSKDVKNYFCLHYTLFYTLYFCLRY